MGIQKGATNAHPFVGSGTTSIVAQLLGINCIGFDVTVLSELAISAKSSITRNDLKELQDFICF
jgi:tRNA G10  N-methylase Trm11